MLASLLVQEGKKRAEGEWEIFRFRSQFDFGGVGTSGVRKGRSATGHSLLRHSDPPSRACTCRCDGSYVHSVISCYNVCCAFYLHLTATLLVASRRSGSSACGWNIRPFQRCQGVERGTGVSRSESPDQSDSADDSHFTLNSSDGR